MGELDISAAAIGDQKNNETVFSVDTQTTDGVSDQNETTYVNEKWPQQLGYYKKIPELKSSIDAKARWVIGKGYKADDVTEITLSQFRGIGKESFNAILKNQNRVKDIGGDSFAEIIRLQEGVFKKVKNFLGFTKSDAGKLINLKPLDPSSIRTVANRQGLLIRYEQINKLSGKSFKTFKPEQMFHLMRDRVADEIHGTSVIDAVEDTILARKEAIEDFRKLLRRNVFPVRIFHLDTDDSSEIAAFKLKQDKAQYQGENIYIPKGAVETEISAVPTNATLNPLAWINQLNQNFYQEVGIPQIINGGSQEITEANGKIAYLAWEQTIEDDQLYLEEQVLAQLGFEINLEFPASLQNELLSDNRKDVESGATSPEDTSVTGVGLGETQ